ncbi:NAD(P)H-dependent oxidoreductase [Gelidibacter sp.]|uniref:NADPH-dependent FMN reductase n=1 Tax=Gelidibacter sp. TaxID=2018083 RepID=UPI003266A3D1
MKKILAFGGSNSSDSINKELANYAASLVEDAQVTLLDLNDFDLPIYSKDLEAKSGIPENAKKFHQYIKETDGIVLSLAENNGAYSSAFKNLFDWMSRHESKLFMGKPMLLMATSTGRKGAAYVLAMAHSRFPYHDAKIVAEFSLPLFHDKFADGKITDMQFDDELKDAVKLFQNQL